MALAPSIQGKVSIVDGMAELQLLDKSTWITTCSQLAEHYMNQLLQKCSESDKIHVVFNRYDVELFRNQPQEYEGRVVRIRGTTG